eukprot:1181472-Prorocentrum_minimum.AAC.4
MDSEGVGGCFEMYAVRSSAVRYSYLTCPRIIEGYERCPWVSVLTLSLLTGDPLTVRFAPPEDPLTVRFGPPDEGSTTGSGIIRALLSVVSSLNRIQAASTRYKS